jgi:hypothetical protein
MLLYHKELNREVNNEKTKVTNSYPDGANVAGQHGWGWLRQTTTN